MSKFIQPPNWLVYEYSLPIYVSLMSKLDHSFDITLAFKDLLNLNKLLYTYFDLSFCV